MTCIQVPVLSPLSSSKCPSWQWHRTGSQFPVQTLPVAPLWCDLGFFQNRRGNKAAANLRPTCSCNACRGRSPLFSCSVISRRDVLAASRPARLYYSVAMTWMLPTMLLEWLANIMACYTPTGAGGPRAVCRPAVSLADGTLAAEPQQEEQQRPEHPNLPYNAYIDTQHALG